MEEQHAAKHSHHEAGDRKPDRWRAAAARGLRLAGGRLGSAVARAGRKHHRGRRPRADKAAGR